MSEQALIRFTCPHCSKRLKAKAKGVGAKVRCPNPACGEAITVPAPAKEAELNGKVSRGSEITLDEAERLGYLDGANGGMEDGADGGLEDGANGGMEDGADGGIRCRMAFFFMGFSVLGKWSVTI